MHKDNPLIEKTAWVITVFLFISFILFENYTWGKYVFLLCSGCLAFFSCIREQKVHVHINFFFVMGMLFAGYTALSSLWSLDPDASIIMARTLVRTVICAMLFLSYYHNKENGVEMILSAIRWCGYLVALYTISYYGLSIMLHASLSASYRLGNGYSNVNTIALGCCMSIIIQVNDSMIAKKKERIGWLLCVPALFVIIATQGRKSLIMLVLGVGVLLILNLFSRKENSHSFFQSIFFILLGAIVMYGVSQLDMFSGVHEQFDQMLNFVTKEGTADSSTIERAHMISAGISYWKKDPLLGYGLDATRLINLTENGRGDYLHNNYVELLCGGGLIAAGIFYSIYLYLYYYSIKYRIIDKSYGLFFVVWLFLLFVLDFGMVSYYTKSQWYYIATIFLHVEALKRKAEEECHKESRSNGIIRLENPVQHKYLRYK